MMYRRDLTVDHLILANIIYRGHIANGVRFRGVHLPEAMMNFPPVSDVPLIFENRWGICQNREVGGIIIFAKEGGNVGKIGGKFIMASGGWTPLNRTPFAMWPL